jgi:hypothetical protein
LGRPLLLLMMMRLLLLLLLLLRPLPSCTPNIAATTQRGSDSHLVVTPLLKVKPEIRSEPVSRSTPKFRYVGLTEARNSRLLLVLKATAFCLAHMHISRQGKAAAFERSSNVMCHWKK